MTVGPHEVVRDERRRRALAPAASRPVDRDGPGQVVDLGRPSPTDAWVRGSSTCAPAFAPMILGREAEALEAGAALLDLAEVGVELDHADRLALVDEVGVGHAAQLVVAPPERLVLASVPAEQLGQEPGRPLLVARRRGGEVHALEVARQRGHDRGDLGGAPLGLGRLERPRAAGGGRGTSMSSRSPRSSRRASSQSRRSHVLTTSSRL